MYAIWNVKEKDWKFMYYGGIKVIQTFVSEDDAKEYLKLYKGDYEIRPVTITERSE